MSLAWTCVSADEPVPPALPPLYETGARSDLIGRILVPIKVNSKGPFQFVLDTGANSTVLTPRLAQLLGLEISNSKKMTLSGVTGSASVPTAAVDEVKAGDVVLGARRLPVSDSLSPDVFGILGVDALVNTRIRMDFVAGKLQIRKARREGVLDGHTRIPAHCQMKLLMMVKASVGRVPVSAVIDTGSQYTLANQALRARLGLPERIAASNATEVIGETLARQRGERRRVPVFRLGGGVQTVSPTFIFGDFHVFRLWGLDDEPAIVVGMDMLGSLEALVIDYQRCEIQVRPRRSPQ